MYFVDLISDSTQFWLQITWSRWFNDSYLQLIGKIKNVVSVLLEQKNIDTYLYFFVWTAKRYTINVAKWRSRSVENSFLLTDVSSHTHCSSAPAIGTAQSTAHHWLNAWKPSSIIGLFDKDMKVNVPYPMFTSAEKMLESFHSGPLIIAFVELAMQTSSQCSLIYIYMC